MSDQEERFKKLEREVFALRAATANAILLATSATDIAYSLASTHPDPTALLHTFKGVSATTEGTVTY